jgi:ribonuclease Z
VLTPDLVLGEPRPGRHIVIPGDTAPVETVRVLAEGADVLIHEATFSEEERDRAEETLHSTALQAAEIARAAGVRLLALTHISPRYFGKELAEEACAVFPATVVPRDFDVIEVPFAERGEPMLVKAGARPDRDAAPSDLPVAPA